MAKKAVAARAEQGEDLGFEDSMHLTAEHIREPDLYPEGTWEIRNVGFSASDVTNRDEKPQKLINLRYEGFEPSEDVDPEALERGGFEGRTLWVRRYISMPAMVARIDGTLARFVNFVRMHGVDTDGLDVDGMCRAMRGRSILADIGARGWQDKQTGETRRDNTATNFASLED